VSFEAFKVVMFQVIVFWVMMMPCRWTLEMLVLYHTTRCHYPEDLNLKRQDCLPTHIQPHIYFNRLWAEIILKQ